MGYKFVDEKEKEYVLKMVKQGCSCLDIMQKSNLDEIRIKYIIKTLINSGDISKEEVNSETEIIKQRRKEEEYVLRMLKQGYTYREIEADSQIDEQGNDCKGLSLPRIKYIKSKLINEGKITQEEIDIVLKKQEEINKKQRAERDVKIKAKLDADKKEKEQISKLRQEIREKLNDGKGYQKAVRKSIKKLTEMERKYLFRMAKEEYARELDGGNPRMVKCRTEFFDFLIANKDNEDFVVSPEECELLKDSLKYNKYIASERYIKYLLLKTYDNNEKNKVKVESIINELMYNMEIAQIKEPLYNYYTYVRNKEREINEKNRKEEETKYGEIR